MIFPPFGLFSPRLNGMRPFIEICRVTWEYPNIEDTIPAKMEATPAINTELLVGTEEWKMILTFLNQRAKHASCLTFAHDKKIYKINSTMTGVPKTAAWEITYEDVALSINPVISFGQEISFLC